MDDLFIRGILRQIIQATAAQKAILAFDQRLEQIREFGEVFIDERLADARLDGDNLERAAGQATADNERHGAVHDLLTPLVGRHALSALLYGHGLDLPGNPFLLWSYSTPVGAQ